MSKPKIGKHLDWPELYRWFEKTYPGQFKREKVSSWLGENISGNGQLVTVDQDLLREDAAEWYDADDLRPDILWFIRTLYEQFPEATDECGAIHLHFWW